MKKFMLISALFLLGGASLFAQSAGRLTEMIQTEKVTYGQMSYFAASSLGIITDGASLDASFQVMGERGLLPAKEVTGATFIPVCDIAYICAKTWNISGSLMYSLFPSPRYAFKMLQAKGIISQAYDPNRYVDGHEALNIITACIETFPQGGN